MPETVQGIEVSRWEDGALRHITDEVVAEAAVTLYLNDQELVTFLSTPENLEDLALGYLLGEGLLSWPDRVETVQADVDRGWVAVRAPEVAPDYELWGQRLLTSGCGQGSPFFRTLDALELEPLPAAVGWLEAPAILGAVRDFHADSTLFRRTGGVHGAALVAPEGRLCFREDIGRHNAVDKVAGFCYRYPPDLARAFFITSGRVSSEIVIKLVRMGVGILVSPSAPTYRAVELARHLGLTLVGFARGRRLNVYAAPQRLKV